MLRKIERRKGVHSRVRRVVKGTAERPRLSVYRSNKQIYAQLINDADGITIAAASSAVKDFAVQGKKVDVAKEVGKQIADKASQAGIKSVVFDRGGFLYHGRVKALAEGAREGGLQF